MEKMKAVYRKLVETTGRVVGQAKKFSVEIAQGVKSASEVFDQVKLEGIGRELHSFLTRVQQVMRQTKARLFNGNTQAEDKLVSLFEPQTEIIRKGKAGKPTEFGKLVKIQEAENQVVIAYEVYDQRPNDKDLLVPSVEMHQQRLNRIPTMVAGDAGFYSAQGEVQVQDMGVKRPSFRSQSFHREHGTPPISKATLVPQRTKVENRLRKTNQHTQTQARTASMPLQRKRRNEKVGRTRRHRR